MQDDNEFITGKALVCLIVFCAILGFVTWRTVLMGGGGWDWQDRDAQREKEAVECYQNHTCSLDSFSDEQLRKELSKRKKRREREFALVEAAKKHNEPLQEEIEYLEAKLKDLKGKLK